MTETFNPPSAFSQAAHINSYEQYQALYEQAQSDPQSFWGELAEKELHWFKKWDKVLEWTPPSAKWFVGGQLNISYNCLDRHLTNWRCNKPALIWEGEPGDSRTLTYAQLYREVCQFANVLKHLGVTKGDRVGIYLPMIPEAAIAMLACARIGAIHIVIFGGFTSETLKDRLNDAQAKLIITADGGFRKDKIIAMKDTVDLAVTECGIPSLEKILVVQRTKQNVTMKEGRDYWWHELQLQVSANCPAEAMDSEDMLFILYTSGTTGKPKGVVHTTGGYNLYTHITTKWIFDIKDTDVYWCTADVGWITGHSYSIYGPLSHGATIIMFEGAPRDSNPGCFWDIIETYKVTIFYTAPTAIRNFMKMGEEIPNARDLSSLRLLGTVGEPINPEAWLWYYKVIGNEKCPIIDTWWQTETGGIMIAPLPGATPTKPGSCTRPFPGIIADVCDLQGNPVKPNEAGYLVVKYPWPSMLRTVYGNENRYVSYWTHIPPKNGNYLYFSGDGVRQDEDGYFWIMGRVDDVITVSAHRLGSRELESVLTSHPSVVEVAVVGCPNEDTGEAIHAFVILKNGYFPSDELTQALKDHVVKKIGAIARPSKIHFCDVLPKTATGKIIRRLLRHLAAGQKISGDTSTLEDQSVLDKLQEDEFERENALEQEFSKGSGLTP